MTHHRQGMKLSWHFSSEIVFDFPDTFREFVDEQSHLAVAEFLMHPASATGAIIC